MKLNYGMKLKIENMFDLVNSKWIVASLAIFLIGCGENENASELGDPIKKDKVRIDNVINDPSEILPFIKYVIQTDSLELLTELCHPDPNRIRHRNALFLCQIGTDNLERIDTFRNWFANASIDSTIVVIADTVWMPLQLGNGEKHPTMVLEKEGEKWYLVGFDWKD